MTEPLSYTVADAASVTGLSQTFIRRAIWAGELKAKHANTRVIVRRADLEAWLDGLPDERREAS